MTNSCFAGVDVSNSMGIAALAIVEKSDSGYQAAYKFWAPENCAVNPDILNLWQRHGWLSAMPGNILDLERVASDIVNLTMLHDFDTLCVDRWGPFILHTALRKMSKIQLVETSLGFDALTRPTTLFLNLIERQQLRYTNRVLDWMLGNMALSRDSQYGMPRVKPNQRESQGSIAGIMATILALKLTFQSPSLEPGAVKAGPVQVL